MTLFTRISLALGALFLLPLHAEIPEAGVADVPAEEGPPTVIDSDHLKMTKLEEETHFIFSNNVKVTTTDMTIFCDRLEVFAGRQEETAGEETDEETSELGRLQKIVAMGNVRILQEDREATSGRAEVFPREGRIELTEKPVLRNAQGRISGARIIFYQGEQEAEVLSDESQPSRVVLPSIPALGANAEKRERKNERSID